MNENDTNVVFAGNTDSTDIYNNIYTTFSGERLETQAYYDYDYRSYLQTIINNQNVIDTDIKKSNDICNAGFTTLLFCLISAFCYILVKNHIRK